MDVVAVCEHDTASAFLAAPHGADSIIISSGTWSLVGIELESYIINEYTYQHNIANEGGYPGHHRLLKNVMGLWLAQECQRFFSMHGTEYSIEDLIDLAQKAQPLQFMINPNDEVFFSPGNMPEKIAAYCGQHGQSVPETPGEIMRCIFESLALHYRYVIEELEEVSGKRYASINIVGGGCQNSLLNQLTANATNRIVYAGPSEATAIGNLIVQLIAHGEIGSAAEGREIIKRSFEIDCYEPTAPDFWDAKYREYLHIIRH
jgi:sugar (pentulose or hexulose) kinase